MEQTEKMTNQDLNVEAIKLAQEKLETLSLELEEGESFPGETVYRKVMGVVLLNNDDIKIAGKWTLGLEEWRDKFKAADDQVVILGELRTMLANALAKFEKKSGDTEFL